MNIEDLKKIIPTFQSNPLGSVLAINLVLFFGIYKYVSIAQENFQSQLIECRTSQEQCEKDKDELNQKLIFYISNQEERMKNQYEYIQKEGNDDSLTLIKLKRKLKVK